MSRTAASARGPIGTAGARWFNGTYGNMATAGAGAVDGDYYLVTGATIPGGIFKKIAGVWTNQNYSLVGPTGATPDLFPTTLLVANRGTTTHAAHRGGGSAGPGGYYRGPYPEETLQAFEACIAAGTVWLNPHVSMLSDGALVLMHDATPDRTTNATGAVNVANYTTAAWKRLLITPQNATLWPGYGVDWGEIHPPFFLDYLDRFGEKSIHLIECTSRGSQAAGAVATAVIAALQSRRVQTTVILSSFTAAELTPVATAGLESMYLAPDYGTSNYTSANITTAMAAGWASGKPKHVGINALPSGATQAQMVTYIGTLTAAGFTVWAYSMVRRYEVAWLLAAGVAGFIHDEPVYAASTAKVHAGTVDPLSLGVWPHGLLHADQSRGRGSLLNGGFQLDYTGASGAQICCYGGFSPPASLTAYTLQADFVWDTLDSDTSRYPQIVLCCPDDRATSAIVGTGNGLVDGYQILLRQAGNGLGFAQFNNTAQTITNNTTVASTGLPPAATAGTVTTFRIQVTSTTLVITLIQASTTYGPWTVTNSTYRGGYFHFGKNASSGTKLVGTWKNISCA